MREDLCDPLDKPEHGDVEATGTVGGIATYSCDDGYVLIGMDERVCEANFEWSGLAPTCGE